MDSKRTLRLRTQWWFGPMLGGLLAMGALCPAPAGGQALAAPTCAEEEEAGILAQFSDIFRTLSEGWWPASSRSSKMEFGSSPTDATEEKWQWEEPPLTRNRVVIDLDRYESNLQTLIQTRLKGDKNKLCPVFKSDGYGHGIAELMKVINKLELTCVGVSDNFDVSEVLKNVAPALRDRLKVMRLKSIDRDSIEQAAKNGRVIEVVQTLEDLDNILEVAAKLQKKIPIQLRIDLNESHQFESLIRKLKNNGSIEVVGIFSHFEEETPSYLERSLALFNQRSQSLMQVLGLNKADVLLHMASSPAVVSNFEESYLDLVRVGTLGYGQPNREGKTIRGVSSIMSIDSYVRAIKHYKGGQRFAYNQQLVPKDTTLGVIPVGQKQGFVDTTAVLIAGRRYPVVNVSNEELYVDLGRDGGTVIHQGLTAVLLGRCDGHELHWSDVTQTKRPAESVSCAINPWLKRTYRFQGKEYAPVFEPRLGR